VSEQVDSVQRKRFFPQIIIKAL